jgi:hypothetical protein
MISKKNEVNLKYRFLIGVKEIIILNNSEE